LDRPTSEKPVRQSHPPLQIVDFEDVAYLKCWNTRGSTAAAPSMPPQRAPAMPGVITSWPCEKRHQPGFNSLLESRPFGWARLGTAVREIRN
jgi:hypothetical protein